MKDINENIYLNVHLFVVNKYRFILVLCFCCCVWCESMWQRSFFHTLSFFLLLFFSFHVAQIWVPWAGTVSAIVIYAHTRMCKWEKFHWTWHHIIHSKQTSDSHVKYSFARLGISFFSRFDFGSCWVWFYHSSGMHCIALSCMRFISALHQND